MASGDYSVGTNCGTNVPALSSCTILVTFSPTATGTRTGVLSVNSANAVYTGLTATLTGIGVDFTFAISPTSGSVLAGESITSISTSKGISGFAATVYFSCTDNAAGSICGTGSGVYVSDVAATSTINITTTSHYTIIGYGGFNRLPLLAVLTLLSGGLLWFRRRSSGIVLRSALAILFVAAGSLGLSGCSGKIPATNAVYTAPGDYTYTISATDGTITHTATYSLHVIAR